MKGFAVVGATGGLGEAVVRRIARRAPVTIGFRQSRDKASALAESVRAAGGMADITQVDTTQSESVRQFMREASDRWGGLQAIVSATGPAIPLCPLSEVEEQDFRRIYEADVVGSFNVLKHGAQVLKTSGGGAMVLFVTTAVLRTLDNDGMSGCPKTAVAALLRQMAREAGPANVRCNGVAPGVIDAGIVHSSFAIGDVARKVIADCMNQTPMGRMGRPEEVAALVDFLVSPDAAYISGQIIGIDGGYSA